MNSNYMSLLYGMSGRLKCFEKYQDMINSNQNKDHFKKVAEYNSSNKARVKRIKNKRGKK